MNNWVVGYRLVFFFINENVLIQNVDFILIFLIINYKILLMKFGCYDKQFL